MGSPLTFENYLESTDSTGNTVLELFFDTEVEYVSYDELTAAGTFLIYFFIQDARTDLKSSIPLNIEPLEQLDIKSYHYETAYHGLCFTLYLTEPREYAIKVLQNSLKISLSSRLASKRSAGTFYSSPPASNVSLSASSGVGSSASNSIARSQIEQVRNMPGINLGFSKLGFNFYLSDIGYGYRKEISLSGSSDDSELKRKENQKGGITGGGGVALVYAIPMSNRALIRIDSRYGLQYQSFLDESFRNDVSNSFSSYLDISRFSIEIKGSAFDRWQTEDSETLYEIRSYQNSAVAGLYFRASRRFDFSFHYYWNQYLYRQNLVSITSIREKTIVDFSPQSLDRREDGYSGSVGITISEKVKTNFSYRFQQSTFAEQSAERDSYAESIMAAVTISPLSKLQGAFAIGAKKLTFEDAETDEETGFHSNINLTYSLRSIGLSFFLSRDLQFSLYKDEKYFWHTSYGANITPFQNNFVSTTFGGQWSELDYPYNHEKNSHHQRYSMTIMFPLVNWLNVGIRGEYHIQDSEQYANPFSQFTLGGVVDIKI
ncbi:hypothetical protein ACFL27_02840 [candidate division CSSED10-310 bacterium]|uniref:Uncharacterized protein n=1 Tax=candidate division CSSED10-310 bacterium TaxID=2855610 RepID=A0ABV6YSF6_UNCC1